MTQAHSSTNPDLRAAVDLFWETLPGVWNQVRGRLRGDLQAHYDLTPEQFHILRLVRKGLCSSGDLAAAQHLSRPAISQGVDGLVTRGLLTRTPSREDRRCVELAVTPQGSALVEAVFTRNRAWLAERLGDLQPEQIAALQRGLDVLKSAFLPSQSERPAPGESAHEPHP